MARLSFVFALSLAVAGCSPNKSSESGHRVITDAGLGGEELYERLYGAFLINSKEAEVMFESLEAHDRNKLKYFIINYKGSVGDDPNSFNMKGGLNRRERAFLRWCSDKVNPK